MTCPRRPRLSALVAVFALGCGMETVPATGGDIQATDSDDGHSETGETDEPPPEPLPPDPVPWESAELELEPVGCDPLPEGVAWIRWLPTSGGGIRPYADALLFSGRIQDGGQDYARVAAIDPEGAVLWSRRRPIGPSVFVGVDTRASQLVIMGAASGGEHFGASLGPDGEPIWTVTPPPVSGGRNISGVVVTGDVVMAAYTDSVGDPSNNNATWRAGAWHEHSLATGQLQAIIDEPGALRPPVGLRDGVGGVWAVSRHFGISGSWWKLWRYDPDGSVYVDDLGDFDEPKSLQLDFDQTLVLYRASPTGIFGVGLDTSTVFMEPPFFPSDLAWLEDFVVGPANERVQIFDAFEDLISRTVYATNDAAELQWSVVIDCFTEVELVGLSRDAHGRLYVTGEAKNEDRRFIARLDP